MAEFRARLEGEENFDYRCVAYDAAHAAEKCCEVYASEDPDHYKGATIEVEGHGLFDVRVENEPTFHATKRLDPEAAGSVEVRRG